MTNIANPLQDTYHDERWITCEPCHRIIPVLKGNPIAEFLCNRGPKCPSCGQRVDVWASILDHLDPFGKIGAIPFGAITTNIQFDVPKHGRTTIVLADHDIPKDARILDRRYCGQSLTRIIPLEVHGHSPQLGPIWDGKITIYGATFPDRTDAPDADVSRQLLSISWIPSGLDVEGWSSLWSALESFATQDHQGVVIPANVAVELVVGRVVSACLESVPEIAPKYLKSFLGDAGYGHRLNVILPAFAHFAGAPKMHERLRADLNELKTLRNDVGHTGKTKAPVGRTQAARLIRAAMFGFHYAHVAEQYLSAYRSDSEPALRPCTPGVP